MPPEVSSVQSRRVYEGRSFVVFLKLLDISPEVGAEECGQAFGRLDALIRSASRVRGAWHLPSPYGAAVIFPNPVSAIAGAHSITQNLKRHGIRVGVGIDWGPLERVYNFNNWNAAAVAINLAARIASRVDDPVALALSPSALEQVAYASSRLAQCFGARQREQVKATPISYHVERKSKVGAIIGNRRLSSQYGMRRSDPRQADIVVFDIVKYSKMNATQQKRAVRLLSDCVERSVSISQESEWSHGPAGDGGYIAFLSGRSDPAVRAWHFSVELRDQCRLVGVPVRIGIAHGPVLFRDGGGAVGGAVLLADRISSLAPSGGIAVSPSFWETFHKSYKSNWVQRQIRSDGIRAAIICDKEKSTNSEQVTQVVLHTADAQYRRFLQLWQQIGHKGECDLATVAKTQLRMWQEELDVMENVYGSAIASSVVIKCREWIKELEEKLK